MYGKLIIQSTIKVLTGMHIGGSSVFSAIGAVDSPVVRDPYTHLPIIPGSTLKGKMRSLLSRSMNDGERCEITKDPAIIKRLFGSHQPNIILSRLQFADCFVTRDSVEKFQHVGLTEIKWENAINRITAVANPRQIERVLPGVSFACSIAYTVEVENDSELEDDLSALAQAMKLLQMDYLGGHGTRGSGRVSVENIKVIDPENILPERINKLQSIFEDAEKYELLHL